jgi:hypothetical protein
MLMNCFFVFIFLGMVLGIYPESNGQTKGSSPVIHFAWAQDEIRQGNDWRIYLSATDPDGDMSKIFCRIDQPGEKFYPLDITRIKKGLEGQLDGYLVLRTYSQQDLFGLSLTITLVIADSAGNESRPVTLPLTINGEKMKTPPSNPAPPNLQKLLNQRLGYIGTELYRRERKSVRGFVGSSEDPLC